MADGIRQPVIVLLVELRTEGLGVLLREVGVADVVPAAAVRAAHDPDLRTHTCNWIALYGYTPISHHLENVGASRRGYGLEIQKAYLRGLACDRVTPHDHPARVLAETPIPDFKHYLPVALAGDK